MEIKFAFFGTDELSVRVLDILRKNGFVPKLVVTKTDKPKGRGKKVTPPPTKVWAEVHNVNIAQRLDKKDFEGFDLFIVASYGRIIPQEILDIPQYGTINVHPSLLPKYRGVSPIRSAMLDGEETGVTIMLIDAEMDHGPILAMRELEFSISNFQFSKLKEKLAELGGDMLVKVIPDWINGKIKPKEQDHSKATYTNKFTKEDALIDWAEPAEKNERKIRAFSPTPGAYFFIKKEGKPYRIIVTLAKIEDGKLKIERIKPEGKKEMSLDAFLHGNSNLKAQFLVTLF